MIAFPRLPRWVAGLPLLTRFRRDKGGVALVEFAYVLPIMVLLYVGTVAVTMGVMTDRKVTLLTRSLGDLVAQATDVTGTDMTDVFSVSKAVLTPYDFSAAVLSMTVSSIRLYTPAGGTTVKACVEWSKAGGGGSARAQGQDVTASIPLDLRTTDTWLIWPEVTYRYTPVVGQDVTGTLTLGDKLYLRPRQSSRVSLNSAPTPAACSL